MIQGGPLLQPYDLKRITLRNRVLAAPMATRYADREGRVSDALLAACVELANTGVGMVVVEAALVAPEGQGWSRQLRACDREALPGLSRLAAAIAERGAVPVLQLHHAGRQTRPSVNGGRPVVGPSPLPCPFHQSPVTELTGADIARIITDFTEAARLAVRAGFLGIELHGAHGYLLHQFVSPLTNRRRDEWGLTAPGVGRFPGELVRSMRAACPHTLLAWRLSARDYLPNGLTLPGAVDLARLLAGAGVDLIHVSGGMAPSLHGPEAVWGGQTGLGVFRGEARAIRAAVPVPVAVTGKIQFPALAAEILAQGDADLVGLGRVLLRDPHWLDKAKGLDDEPIRTCLLCGRCQYHLKGCPDAPRRR